MELVVYSANQVIYKWNYVYNIVETTEMVHNNYWEHISESKLANSESVMEEKGQFGNR